MTSRLADGAVARPSDQTVLQKLASLKSAYPSTAQHVLAFRRLGSEYIYADIKDHPKLGRIGVALLRLSNTLEQTFGFTRELLVLYTPHSDLQVRTFSLIRQVINDLPREVTPDTALLWAADPRLDQKLDDWSTSKLTVLPLPMLPDDPAEGASRVIDVLTQRLFARDLFPETTPVSGQKFFGRKRLLQALEKDLLECRSPGLFGMRKTGKTSVLRQLQQLLLDRDGGRIVFIIKDLESLPLPTEDPIPELLADLTQNLLTELRSRKLRTYELVSLNAAPSIPDFRRAFQTLMRKLDEEHLTFIFALDEVEYLCPPGLTTETIEEAQSIPRFLGALRSIQQETPGFTFILSGISSAPSELPTLYGRTNPIFSWSKAYYLQPFSRKESDELVNTISFRMGASWDDGSLDEIHTQTGGHPFLLRGLASTVMQLLPIDPNRRTVYRSHVESAARPWKRDTAGITSSMLQDLRRNYPDEMALLELLEEDREAFSRDIAAAEERSLGRLIDLGLVESDTARAFRPSPLYVALTGARAHAR